MSEKKITCIECPVGCEITVEVDNGEVLSVTGNGCPRGKLYASSEVICPRRVITSTVKKENGGVLPVKTDKPVKKSEIFDVMQKINGATAKSGVRRGDIIVENITEDINLIATDDDI